MPIGWLLEEVERRKQVDWVKWSEQLDQQVCQQDPSSEIHPVVVRVFLRLFGEKDVDITLANQYHSEHFRKTVMMKVCDRCYTECTEHVVVPLSEKTTLQARKTFMNNLDDKREEVFLEGIRADLHKRLKHKKIGEESEDMKLLENLKYHLDSA